jgi:trehalose 6-phosphate phosphatase
VETKAYGIALHYRRAPDREAWVRDRIERVARALGPDYCIQTGAAVAEIRTSGFDKSTALERLRRLAPFQGRCPLYFGDDATDVPALEFAERHAGIGVVVGPRLDKLERPFLEGPSQVREVLLGLAVALKRAKREVQHRCDL